MATKTKKELLEEIDQLKAQLDNLKRFEDCKEHANLTAMLYGSYIDAGFSEKQAFELITRMMVAAISKTM